MKFDTFEEVYLATQPDLRGTIQAALLDEARLMVVLAGTRLTERAIDREVRDAEVRFLGLVKGCYNDRKPLTADDVINHRAIWHLAWAIAEKLHEKGTK